MLGNEPVVDDVVDGRSRVVDSRPMPTVAERIAHIEGQLGLLLKVLSSCAVILIGLSTWGFVTISGHNSRLAVIESYIPEQRLKQISDNPALPDNVQTASQILRGSRKDNVRLDPAVVVASGQKFISAAESNPSSWPAVEEFLNYRSFLNISTAPNLPEPPNEVKLPEKTWYFKVWKEGGEKPRFMVFGFVPPKDAAYLEPIGQKLNPDTSAYGRQFLVVEGGDTLIDGLQMKNVVFRDSRVGYLGGVVKLDNVYFINCTFQFAQRDAGLTLAESLLKSNPVTYPAS